MSRREPRNGTLRGPLGRLAASLLLAASLFAVALPGGDATPARAQTPPGEELADATQCVHRDQPQSHVWDGLGIPWCEDVEAARQARYARLGGYSVGDRPPTCAWYGVDPNQNGDFTDDGTWWRIDENCPDNPATDPIYGSRACTIDGRDTMCIYAVRPPQGPIYHPSLAAPARDRAGSAPAAAGLLTGSPGATSAPPPGGTGGGALTPPSGTGGGGAPPAGDPPRTSQQGATGVGSGGDAVDLAWAHCLKGAVTAGFSLLVYQGGSVQELVDCAESRGVAALYALHEGSYRAYILAAPAFVNRPFAQLFADGVPALTPLVAASDGPPSADPAGVVATPGGWPACLHGTVAATGFSAVVYAGGSVQELAECAGSSGATVLYVLHDGRWVSYTLGAAEEENRDFAELFPDGVPALTPLIVKGEAHAVAEALRAAVGQMLLVGFRGVTLDAESRAMISGVQPGGVLLFDHDSPSGGAEDRNITGPEQLRALTAELQEASAIPLLIAVDAEGGYVQRLKPRYGFSVDVPSAESLGRGSPEDTAAVASDLAAELRAHGINWNLAPVVDVDIDPESPAIGALERSFSADPAAVTAHARAFIEAHSAQGVIATLKHFPGHGSAAGDTHAGVTDVTATFRRGEELAPYRLLIAEGYDGPVMTAHIVNRNLDESGRPATLSRLIMTDLLRGELGFGGLLLSDDMQMGAIVAEYGLEEAAVEAVRAGVDVIMLTNQHAPYDLAVITRVRDAILGAVGDGRITVDRIHESLERITALKRDYGVIE